MTTKNFPPLSISTTPVGVKTVNDRLLVNAQQQNRHIPLK
jgi:hypothetical protein